MFCAICAVRVLSASLAEVTLGRSQQMNATPPQCLFLSQWRRPRTHYRKLSKRNVPKFKALTRGSRSKTPGQCPQANSLSNWIFLSDSQL